MSLSSSLTWKPALLLVLLFFGSLRFAVAEDVSSQEADFFEKKIRPLLIERCHKCHAGSKVKGGLRLDSGAALLRGGESGPAVISGKPDESRLIQAVRHQEGLKMPPDGKLAEAQIAALAAWVKAGAHWPDSAPVTLQPLNEFASRATFTPEEKNFWAYQSVRDSSPPAVKNEAWIKSPIDRFILAKLESLGVAPAPPADKLTLLRRVTFDLTGLPPTPEEVHAFELDSIRNPHSAFPNLVDRLLDSPHYGERWGRHLA